jgi:hypothetical protein
MKEDDARRLLDRVAIFRHAWDLDLMLFFARHPRTLLTSESLASFLGYELKQIADALEILLAAGVIERTQTSAHAARLYLLVPDAANHQWFQPLVEMGSTRQGRTVLRKALSIPSREGSGGPETIDTKAKTSTRSILIRRDQRSRNPYRRGGR